MNMIEQTQLYLHGFKTFHQRYHAYPQEVDKQAAILCDAIKTPVPDKIPSAEKDSLIAVKECLITGVAAYAAHLLHPERAVPQTFDRFVETLFEIATPFEKRGDVPAEPVGEAGVVALTVIALCLQDTHPARMQNMLRRLNRLDAF